MPAQGHPALWLCNPGNSAPTPLCWAVLPCSRGGQGDSEPGGVPISVCSSCRHTAPLPPSFSSRVVKGIIAQGAGALLPALLLSHTRPSYQRRGEGLAAPPMLPPLPLPPLAPRVLSKAGVGSPSCPQHCPRLCYRLKAAGREFLRTGAARRAPA